MLPPVDSHDVNKSSGFPVDSQFTEPRNGRGPVVACYILGDGITSAMMSDKSAGHAKPKKQSATHQQDQQTIPAARLRMEEVYTLKNLRNAP